MNYFVSQIDVETVIVFFLIGTIFCTIYMAISKVLCLLNNKIVFLSFKKTPLNPISFETIKKNGKVFFEYQKGKTPPDALRALMIFSLGIVLTFSLYALCDGVPRIYALLITAIGYLTAYFIFELILSVIFGHLCCGLVCIVIFALTRPLKWFSKS